MRLLSSLALLAAATTCHAAGPSSGQIKNLVTFGDSYTDVVSVSLHRTHTRLTAKHAKVNTGDNGTAWPVFAAEDGHFRLFPFARSGATCSNNITFRPFPSVFESQLPLFFAELRNGSLNLIPEETLFTLWIGTNDVGANSLLTGGGAVGATVANTTMCAIDWVKTLYQSGFRNFLFQNVSEENH